jgi:hypothetical protein
MHSFMAFFNVAPELHKQTPLLRHPLSSLSWHKKCSPRFRCVNNPRDAFDVLDMIKQAHEKIARLGGSSHL